jgi:hypothetical protein
VRAAAGPLFLGRLPPGIAPTRSILLRLRRFLAAADTGATATATATATRGDPISRRELNFKFVDLVPLRVRTVALRYGKEFPQATSWIRRRRLRGGSGGLFFVHAQKVFGVSVGNSLFGGELLFLRRFFS